MFKNVPDVPAKRLQRSVSKSYSACIETFFCFSNHFQLRANLFLTGTVSHFFAGIMTNEDGNFQDVDGDDNGGYFIEINNKIESEKKRVRVVFTPIMSLKSSANEY